MSAAAPSLGFFAQVDRLVSRWESERDGARAELHRLGWILRPQSIAGAWRARRHSARTDFEERLKKREARRKKAPADA